MYYYSPNDLDIFKEIEVTYMASLLKKKSTTYHNPDVLKEIHDKSKLTFEVLTLNMVSGDISIQRIIDLYKECNRENVIRLLLRCKNMFEVRMNVKRILLLLIQRDVSNLINQY